jgi:single-stranded DNA-binding protein
MFTLRVSCKLENMLAIKVQTYWHDCVVYGGYAPFAAKLNKGTHIVIEGELTYREYNPLRANNR